MKMVGRIGALLVVLAMCLPSYGEILVYKLSETDTDYYVEDGHGDIEKTRWKSYLLVDVDYGDNTIVEAQIVDYWTDEDGRWFEVYPLENLELARVTAGGRVTWAITRKYVQMDGGEITDGDFSLLTGAAKARNVGTGTNREVANKLSGYSLWEYLDVDYRNVGFGTLSLTLYPAWTYWANRANQGNQDIDATANMIAEYLEGKGYEEW